VSETVSLIACQDLSAAGGGRSIASTSVDDLASGIDIGQCVRQTGAVDSTGTRTEPPEIELAHDASCAPTALSGGLSAERAADLARVLKALADPARLRLLSLVAASPTGEACICDLTGPLELSQPTLSHHCKVLVDAGFLRREKRGVWAHYSLVPGAMQAVGTDLPGIASPATA
jgi:ArsR family transcriptional regulator